MAPEDFDPSTVPFSTPLDWYLRNKDECDKHGYTLPNINQPLPVQRPEPEVIDVEDDDEDPDVDAIDEWMQDSSRESGFSSYIESDEEMEMEEEEEDDEELCLINLVMDPLDQGLFDLWEWRRKNPVVPHPPIPTFDINNNANPLMVFADPKYRFDFENPPKPPPLPELPVFDVAKITPESFVAVPETEEEILARRVPFREFGKRLHQRENYIKKHY